MENWVSVCVVTLEAIFNTLHVSCPLFLSLAPSSPVSLCSVSLTCSHVILFFNLCLPSLLCVSMFDNPGLCVKPASYLSLLCSFLIILMCMYGPSLPCARTSVLLPPWTPIVHVLSAGFAQCSFMLVKV